MYMVMMITLVLLMKYEGEYGMASGISRCIQ